MRRNHIRMRAGTVMSALLASALGFMAVIAAAWASIQYSLLSLIPYVESCYAETSMEYAVGLPCALLGLVAANIVLSIIAIRSVQAYMAHLVRKEEEFSRGIY